MEWPEVKPDTTELHGDGDSGITTVIRVMEANNAVIP